MGAWGYGPFQSDTALDAVDQVCGSGNPAREAEKVLKGNNRDEAWGLIGLIELSVNPDTSRHAAWRAQFGRQLSQDEAYRLAPLALAVCQEMQEDEDWIDLWGNDVSLLAELLASAEALSKAIDAHQAGR